MIKYLKLIFYWLFYHLCFGEKRKKHKMKYKKIMGKIFPNDLKSVLVKTAKIDLYVLTYHSGEIFTFLMLLRSSKNYSEIEERGLLIATQKYHIDLIQMVTPKIKYRFVPQASVLIRSIKKDLLWKDKNIHIVFPKFIADSWHPLWLKKDLKVNCFSKLYEAAELDVQFSERPKLFFDDTTKNKLKKKIKKNRLREKFVFIAPEALTIQPISIDFWKILYQKFTDKGFDVFWNITQNKEQFNFGKTFDLSVKEANLLARQASGIISLRSGFSEQLAVIGTIPNIILYTNTWGYKDAPMIPVTRFHEIASLKNYPYASDNIYEFDAVRADEALADKIVQIITKERS